MPEATPNVGIAEAAQSLGVHPSTLWQWLAAGAPVSRRGRKGRGSSKTLVDLEALRAWRARTAAASTQAPSSGGLCLHELLAVLPEMVAEAAWQTLRAADGNKRALAPELAAMALRVLGAVSDRAEGMPPLTEATLPEKLMRLRQISG